MIAKKTKLKKILELGKECKNCGHCCTHTSGFILPEEIPKIASYLNMDKKTFTKKCLITLMLFNQFIFRPKLHKKDKPYGTCIFYDKKLGCSIQKVKPLHCRITSCSQYGDKLNAWYLLNYLVDEDDPESLRQWNLFLKSGGTQIPGGNFSDLVPDDKIRKKLLNYELRR